MIKLGLGKLFQYNSELSCVRLFGQVELCWFSDVSFHTNKCKIHYERLSCNCYTLDIAQLGITFLGKDCCGMYE